MARVALVALISFGVATGACKPVELVIQGDHRDLRNGEARARPSSPDAPPILVIAFDGVSRSPLYHMRRAGPLPNFARLPRAAPSSPAHCRHAIPALLALPSHTA